MVTCGERHVSRGQPRPHPKEAGPQRPQNFGTFHIRPHGMTESKFAASDFGVLWACVFWATVRQNPSKDLIYMRAWEINK